VLADPESTKNTVKSSVFFALLVSARVKAARKMMMKLTEKQGVHLVQLLSFLTTLNLGF